jgi:outer membrane lipoprotein SlyB
MIISITNRAGVVAAVVGAVVAVLGADLPQGSGVLLAIVLGVVAGGIADTRLGATPEATP